jgi:hypothetical protein
LTTVDVHDDRRGGSVAIEVGYGFFGRQGQPGTIYLGTGAREKQLLFEATSLKMVRFVRQLPDNCKKPGLKPRRSYRPQADLAR